MVFEKKQLSKALAIALMVACAVAFMPLLNGQAFAAAKKPAKVKSLKASQVANTVTAKVTWKKGKNCKKYNVKVDGTLVSKNQKAKSYTTDNLTVGAHKISVAGVNGKKVGKYKTVTVNIKAVVAAVKIDGVANVGATLTAVVYDPNGNPITDGVTYQWYRVNRSTGIVAEISGATGATYQIAAADGGDLYTIFVEATAGGQKVQSEPTKLVTNVRELGSVEIVNENSNHAVPQLGDTLGIEIKDTVGDTVKVANVDIQWYADGKAISGADDATYTVQNTRYVGKSLTVTVKAKKNNEYYKGEVTSKATDPVIESTTPKRVDIETSAGAPFVGETAKAVFLPAGTFDDDATYQWYRNNAKIAGATDATYTVTKNDLGATLKVEATLSNEIVLGDSEDTQGYNNPTARVQEALTGATIALTSNNPDGDDIYTTSDKAIATVRNAQKTEITDDFTYAWYIDSVAEENQLFEGTYDATHETQAAADDSELVLSDGYYLAKVVDPSDTVDLVGHKLIAVASTYAGNWPQGTVTSAPTDAIKVQVFTGKATITGDTGDNYYVAGKTTLTVDGLYTIYNDEPYKDAEVTYTWYKKAKSSSKWTVISGATTASCPISEDDAGYMDYKVTVVGIGNFQVTGEITMPESVYVRANTSKIDVNPVISGGKVVEVEKDVFATYAQPGTTLTAGVDVAAAAAHITKYTWTYAHGGKTVAVDGPTYTVPDDAVVNDTITLTATPDLADYDTTDRFDIATVQTAIKSVTLKSTASRAAATGVEGHDGIAYPNVGEELSVEIKDANDVTVASDGVTYQWLADGKKIDGADDATLTIGTAQIGKKISVTVEGNKANYYGATLTSTETGVVDCLGQIRINYWNGSRWVDIQSVGENQYEVHVGDSLWARVYLRYYYHGEMQKQRMPELEDGIATFTWTIGSHTEKGEYYDVNPDDVGNTIKCEVSGVTPCEEGALTWDSGLEIAE